MDVVKGLLVEVLKGKYQATNDGISSKSDEFVLTGEMVDTVMAIDAARVDKILVLKRKNGYMYVEPAYAPGTGYNGWMMGGNFIWSSDSRFPIDYPIPVHDRREVYENEPEYGKQYALTGVTGEKCIANGNTWAESRVV